MAKLHQVSVEWNADLAAELGEELFQELRRGGAAARPAAVCIVAANVQ